VPNHTFSRPETSGAHPVEVSRAIDPRSLRLDLRVGSKVYGPIVTTYRISQLVERCGVPATTLRFYESAGLLPAERTPAGYRVYDDTAVDRLAFIASAKYLGLSLDEIRDLLDARERDVCAAVREQLLRLVESRIADTDRRIAELSAFNAHLAGVHLDLTGPAPAGACGPDCGCVTAPPTGPVLVTLGRTRNDQAVDLSGDRALAREQLGVLT
jgi:DNA-binding transcriptional MerR regulator